MEMEAKLPNSVNPGWFADTLNGNIRAMIMQDFPGIVAPTGRGSYCILLPPKHECYIKKLTSGNLLPQYNHSYTSAAMCNARALDGQEALPVIFIGPTLDESNEMVTGCYAVCIEGLKRNWVTNLNEIEPPQRLEVPAPQTTPPPTPIVKIRRTIPLEIPKTK